MLVNKIEIFIDKAKKVHGEKYDYNLVEYIDCDTKVKIKCNKCDKIFDQAPSGHLRKNGCPDCANESRKKTKDQFIKEAKEKHGNKFDYSFVEYTNCYTKIKIKCSKHGFFEQTPSSHLNTVDGCIKCATERVANEQRKTTEQFIKEAIAVHGNKYDYSLVNYINDKTKIIIICQRRGHGQFMLQPCRHLNKQECPECAKIEKNY
jgi:hypothetical protein